MLPSPSLPFFLFVSRTSYEGFMIRAQLLLLLQRGVNGWRTVCGDKKQWLVMNSRDLSIV